MESTYAEFLTSLYTSYSPSKRVVPALSINDNTGSSVETTVYDLFEFFLNTLMEGFKRLRLSPYDLDASLPIIQRHFDIMGIKIHCKYTDHLQDARNSYCAIMLQPNDDEFSIGVYKNHKPVSELEQITATFGPIKVSFSFA